MIADTESYFGDLLREQELAVKRYRLYSMVLLGAGGLCVAITVALTLAASGATDTPMDMFVRAMVPVGGGLITSATSAYPIKEMIGRREKIITYRRLLEIAKRVGGSPQANSPDGQMIHERMQSVIDTITKGC